MITSAAMKAGFRGGLVIDNPNSTKTKKLYLVLTAGSEGDLGMVSTKEKIAEEEKEEKDS